MCDPGLYQSVPDDWCLCIADIADSTGAVARGRYKDVNIVSACAIIAVLNALDGASVAYVFGGDGATILAHKDHCFAIACALAGTQAMAREAFGLKLRAGIVGVGDLVRDGAPVGVAKIETAPGIFQAALSGEGVSLAERRVKTQADIYAIDALYDRALLAAHPARFDGLECRWQPLHSRNGHTVSLIVQSRAGPDAYNGVLSGIASICGQRSDWRPVSEAQLDVGLSPFALASEIHVHAGATAWHVRAAFLLRLWVLTLFGKAALRMGFKAGSFDGAAYRAQTVAHSDYMKFDNALRAVMDISTDQKNRLTDYLETQYRLGRIYYGLHTASAALMTCMVFSYDQAHFHFIDGAEGGYSLAARQLKAQIAASAAQA